MAISTAQVSVGTSATVLSASETDSVSGSSVAVQNVDAVNAVYIGASSVTTGTGYKVAAGGATSMDLDPGEVLYGIVASGTVMVHVLRTGV